MANSLTEFNKLTDAEQYFQFFELPYDPQVVNVNRLHILKQFANAMGEIDASFPSLTEADRLAKYQEALAQAYNVFLTSSAVQTKLFKVFNEKPQNVVLLSEIGQA
uniref:Nitrogenase-stabilizing/protective protein NifW n=1 Tax=Cyanothece sp. (strain PCC 7425 / ATCC 29141) TaxID=395961 RepID=B8HM98_CYAP4